MGAIPWVIMQVILVFVVIFVPQSVTMFLDKEIKVDIDKVQIEMPADDNRDTKDPAAELLNKGSPADTAKAAEKAADDEQKKIDDLFKK
jgi:hypothetical protein